MTDAPWWLRTEVPPAGGLARLHAAIESRWQAPRHAWRARSAWAGALAATIVVAFAAGSGYRAHVTQRAFADSLQAALSHAQADSVREHGVLRDLPSRRADVRIVVLEPRKGAVDAPAQR